MPLTYCPRCGALLEPDGGCRFDVPEKEAPWLLEGGARPREPPPLGPLDSPPPGREFWYAWKDQLADLGRTHRAVAVDMRGYNLSSKPPEVEAYALPHLVEDVRALTDRLADDSLALVGHDWGGVVTWAFARAHRDRLRRLVIINAPHPAVFRRELRENPAQRQASQYVIGLRSPGAEAMLSGRNS